MKNILPKRLQSCSLETYFELFHPKFKSEDFCRNALPGNASETGLPECSSWSNLNAASFRIIRHDGVGI